MNNKMKRGGHTFSFAHTSKEAKDNRNFYHNEIKPRISGYVPDYIDSKNKKKRRRIGLLQRIARLISRPTY